jgi:hypothetical protein
MEKSQKRLTVISLIILALSLIAVIVFTNLTEDISNILISLEENKAQSKVLGPDSEELDIPIYLPDAPEAQAAFWKIDPDSFKKAEYIGIAAIKDGRIYINVKHSNLKAVLENSYTPLEPKREDPEPPYKPGTTLHLRSIAKESWRWQYTSEYKD